MVILYGSIFLGTIIFIISTCKYGNKRIKGLNKKEHPLKTLYSGGAFLADSMDALRQLTGKQKAFPKKQQKLRELTILEDVSNAEYLHEAKRFSMVLLCLLVAGGIGLVTQLQAIAENNPKITSKLARGIYGEGERSYELLVEGLKEAPTKVLIEVGERKYSAKEAEEVFRKVYLELRTVVLGENTSVEKIQSNLNLATSTSYAGIEVRWETEDVDLVDSWGILGDKIPPQGKITQVTANLTDGDHEASYVFHFRVYPPLEHNREEQILKFKETLTKLDIEQQEKDSLQLPATYEGKTLSYHKVEEENNSAILILGLLASIIIFFAADYQLDEQIKLRDRQMLLDYSEIVSKLTVLMGAGLTVKSAWERIIKDYEVMVKEGRKGKRYAYEEMELAFYSMKNGTYEGRAYGTFGRRCRLHPYIKLGGLLEQNIKTGTKNLKGLLELESSDAFLERKVLARRLGEEAGTKLLVPMFLMLAVVMIVIVVPAFLSFS